MTTNVTIPDDLATKFGGNLSRRLLEGIALLGFNNRVLSHGQVRQLLGLDRWETEEFLKANHAKPDLTAEEVESDISTLKGIVDKR